MYSLDQLRGFVAVAEELHFGKAADRLNMTQPPLSRQIQKLERSIKVRLFDRDNRRVVLTTAGEAFLNEARKLLALAESAPELARRISAGSAGVVRIGFTAASTYGLLGGLLNEIGAALPEIDIDLAEMVTHEQVSALTKGEVDLGLARPPFNDEILDSRLLYREGMVAALPADHPLAWVNDELTLEDLQNEPMIMHSPTQARYFYDLVVRMAPAAGLRVVHTVSQIHTMISLVAAGRGIALVPHSATLLGIEGVAYVPLGDFEQEPVELYAIWMRDSKNPALSRVLEVIEGNE